jgi:hypothetical protein
MKLLALLVLALWFGPVPYGIFTDGWSDWKAELYFRTLLIPVFGYAAINLEQFQLRWRATQKGNDR